MFTAMFSGFMNIEMNCAQTTKLCCILIKSYALVKINKYYFYKWKMESVVTSS